MNSGKKKSRTSKADLDDTMENCTPGERKGHLNKFQNYDNHLIDTITDSVNESTLLRSKNMNAIENSPDKDNSFLQSSFWIPDNKVKNQVLKAY
jgi:hypothetical protein